MANEPKMKLALVGEMPENPVRGTVYMSPDTSGNFVKVGVDGSVRTIFDGSNYVLKEESPWVSGEGEGSAVLKQGGSEANGEGAVVHGDDASAFGLYSHAEGIDTIAYGNYSHAEGESTTAVGNYSHAEGKGEYYNLVNNTISGEAGSTSYTLSKSALYSQNQVIYYANTNTYAKIISRESKTLNLDRTLDPDNALIDASFYTLNGYANDYSHAEGYSSSAQGLATHAEGHNTAARGNYSHTEGYDTITNDAYDHAEGYNTSTNGTASHAEGYKTSAQTSYSHAEGYSTNAHAQGSHTEGNLTNTYGQYSHTEGGNTMTRGDYSHAEGRHTTAYGTSSHAEGEGTNNTSNYIKVKRDKNNSDPYTYITQQPHNLHVNDILVYVNIYARVTDILSDTSFRTDSNINTWGYLSNWTTVHIVGNSTAYGYSSHAEGGCTKAIGEYSHAEGYYTVTSNAYEHAQGMYNISNYNTLFSVGVGRDISNRKNAIEIKNNGDMYICDIKGNTKNEKVQDFLNINSITYSEYNNIFGIDPGIARISDLLRSHLIIDRFPDELMPDFIDMFGSLENYIDDIVTVVDNQTIPGWPAPQGASSSNTFEWTGDIMEIDNTLYYVWYCIETGSIYGLMPVNMSLETCVNNSMHYDIGNRWSPFEYIIFGDDHPSYTEDLGNTYTLIYVKEFDYDIRVVDTDFNLLNATLYLDNFMYGNDGFYYNSMSFMGYREFNARNIYDYITEYCENHLNDGESTVCTYSEDITLDDETYHLWYCENTGEGYEFYGCMNTTVTVEEVVNNSKYVNPFNLYCPFEYILNYDNMEIYEEGSEYLKKRRCLITVVPEE
jgi:hypothetical protein